MWTLQNIIVMEKKNKIKNKNKKCYVIYFHTKCHASKFHVFWFTDIKRVSENFTLFTQDLRTALITFERFWIGALKHYQVLCIESLLDHIYGGNSNKLIRSKFFMAVEFWSSVSPNFSVFGYNGYNGLKDSDSLLLRIL